MRVEFITLFLEFKKWVKLIPARFSYIVIAIFLTRTSLFLLENLGEWGKFSYLIPFFPYIAKFFEGSGKSELSKAFFNCWYEAIPPYVHWLMIDCFVYYFLAKAYLPKMINYQDSKAIKEIFFKDTL